MAAEDDEKRRQQALAKILAVIGREELKLISFYTKLLDSVNDEDAQYLFRKLINESSRHLTLDTEMMVQLAPRLKSRGKPSRAELEQLLKILDEAESLEAEALKMYNGALPELEDPYVRGTAMWIRDDELRHVKMVGELKEIIKRKIARL